MADSSDQSSGFWTLTRPSKLSKRRNSDLHELHHKVFNISVVGLSGVEKDKGPIGIGKSCLCNRFVRSAADDYHTDHISVLSQSDFSGRVVNNDHWLYWGSVIKSCDGYDLAFNVIEQSEFVDDACFQPFKSGKTEPYYKRCANTKLVSAEKLMYICKNQLGIEREYEQRYLPDGKFNVDGFLCLFDVSEVHGRNIEKQIELTNLIMLNLIKTKKPIVFVTTKNDEVNEMLVVEAERIVNQRECRGLVPIVETSAQENININMAFLVCAQLIDKTRAKLRVPPYFEAYRNHIELLNAAGDAYLGLIRSTVLDHRSSWQQICIKLSHNPEFLQYTYLHGLDKANLVFKSHIKRLRDECIGQKVQNYLKIFPDILNEMVPRTNPVIGLIVNNNNSSEAAKSSSSGPRQSWKSVREQIRSHPLFSKYFIQLPPDINWYDTELLQSAENRIPSDWLESEEAFSVYQQRTLQLESEQQRQNSRELFAQMLKNIRVPVGKPFVELKHIFVNTPDLGILSDKELFEVYVEYQNNLLQRGRTDFQELLLENAEHLHNLTSSNKVIRQEDIKTINAILQHDERYQALDRFDQDRTLMIIRHLSFLHSQLSEQCPSYPKCVEPEIERLLITKAKALVSKYFESKNDSKPTSSSSNPHSQKTCDLVIFGPRRPSQQLILALNVLNSKAPKASQYQITFTVFDNADEVDTQIQRFRKSDTKPKGCFGIFTNRRSLEHVSYTLEKFLILNSQIQNDKNHFGSPPIVMLYAADITLDERTMLALENEGQQMADRFKCPFMNVTAIDQYRQHQQNNILTNDQDSSSQVMSECASLDYACVDAAFNVLKEAVSRRVCFMELYNNQDLIPRQAFNPDARILMCLLCGEPFSNELIMWRMFLDYEDCYVTSSKSICLKVKLDGTQEKFIEVTITSYTHGAFDHREELLHGFILVCSMQRRASISILNAFSSNIPCTPVLVMAVKSAIIDDDCNRFSSSSSSSISANNQAPADETNVLIAEAQTTAARLKGHFELFDLTENNQSCNNNGEENSFSISRIKSFLHNVIKRKPTIEKAYESGEADITSPATSNYDNNDYLKKIDDKINYKQKERSTPKQTLQSQQPQQKFQKQQPHHHNQQPLISSDDDLNESNPALDKNLSDDSEAYSTTSSSALQARAAVFAKTGQEERRTTLNELYLKRPLPPIPPTEVYYASRELDKDVDVLPPTSDKVLGNKKFDSCKHMQASEETNDSSSEGDTEDSTEAKLDKPKPGKLDLSQFDNITNAIGKLNVKAQTKSPAVDFKSSAANSKVFTSKIMQDNSPQESGFFKGRTRKVKGRTKDSPQREPRKSGSNDQLASLTTRERQSEVRGTSQEQSRTDANARAFGAAKTSAIYRMKSDLGEDDRLAGRGNISDRSSRNNNWNDLKPQNRLPTSSFLQNAQDNLDTSDLRLEKELPKPAPRSTAQALNSRGSAVATGAASSGSSGSASGTKRLANPRQNHGRAVAPPQLPPELLSSSISRPDGESISGGQPTNESISQITADEAGIDFSQSPIAQRLLKQSRDYKVSEINSPYESENEQSQSMNLLRGHKLYRGQSLGSENSSPNSLFNNSSIDSSELINSRGAAIRQLNEILANKQNPAYLGGTKPSINRTTSLDQDNQEQTPVAQSSSKKNEKDSKKVDKKKLRDDEKMEKRRLKEEERLRRQEKKLAAKKSKSSIADSKGSVGDDGVPSFIKRCIEFIEQEGLDAEGIYRVPGNRAHVDAFVQKFKENPYMSIVESDIPVNAVATALKDFLSKKWGPIIPLALMNELTGLSNISEKEQRVQAVRQLIKKLPTVNYKLLKYVFSHFVKVSLNHSLNSMDSKNLAICWWPTLLPLHFSDMVMFEQMRPHLEESIQTMIDQYDYIFDSEEPTAAT